MRAVAVVLHGLNLNPARMDDWAAMLRRLGAEVIRLPLHGHRGDADPMRDVNADVWRRQFERVVDEGRADASRLGVPLHFIGYSLGALVCLEWMSRQPEGADTFDALVLAAPALSVPRYARTAIRALSAVSPRLVLPSRSPRRYRANRGTPAGAYEALFALKDALERNVYRNANRPALVLIDRRDELVDSREIVRLIDQHGLERWTVREIDNSTARRKFGFRHLVVDEHAMGHDLWAAVEELVASHLNLAPAR